MSTSSTLGRQIGDFLTYILLPLFCVLLPYRWGQGLLLLVARRGWLLKSRSELALQRARLFVPIEDSRAWQCSWRLVEMMEARDLWLCTVGRARSISRRVRIKAMPEPGIGLVLLGMHYGPAAIVLKILQQAGLGPRFVYRGMNPEMRRRQPFRWLYTRLNVKYIQQTCQGRDISVGGARARLQAALKETGTPVVLLDAPVTREGQSIRTEVLGLEAEFSADGPAILAKGGARCVHYWMEVDEDGERVLHFGPPHQPQSAGQLMTEFAVLMSRTLSENSAHWRLWHVADQLFRSRLQVVESPPGA